MTKQEAGVQVKRLDFGLTLVPTIFWRLRVIYFLRTRHGQIWMLTLDAKNVAENISARVLKQIKDEIDG